MVIRLTIVLGLLALAGVSPATSAEPICFCLQNPATLTIERRGCEARPIPNRASKRVVCQTQDFLAVEPVRDHGKYTQVPDGEGLCTPCVASPVDIPEDEIRNLPKNGSDTTAAEEEKDE